MRLWIADAPRAVLGLTVGGALIAQCPEGAPVGLRAALAGFAVSTLLAPDGQVPALIAAIGLSAAALRHHAEEPGFRLDLDALSRPDSGGCRSRALSDGDRPLLLEWRAAYLEEIFSVPPDEAAVKAQADVQAWIARGSHRLLVRDGVPVALSGFNAVLPDAVQVGAVYTPPPLRGQGLARRAVAAHLADVQTTGVRRAYLFAASGAAARAYAAIGFRRSGSMGLAQFAEPHVLADPAVPALDEGTAPCR